MTNFFMNTVRNFGVVLAVAASLSAVTSTSSYAYSDEARAQCTGDAFRLCSSEIPNISKITACMVKNKSSLSAGCRAVMDRGGAEQKSKVAAQ
jgi:ABC-type molybdate transport system permease subunit